MDNPCMLRAIQLSIDTVVSGQGGPFGAVIVRNREILSEGVNRVTTEKDPTAQAEITAIRQACAKCGFSNSRIVKSIVRANPVPCAWERFMGRGESVLREFGLRCLEDRI